MSTNLSPSPAIDQRTAPVAASTLPTQLPLVTLQQMLGQTLRFGPSYEGAMSNHLPMALHAAWEMGADQARLQALMAHDAAKLEPAPQPASDLPPEAALAQGWLQWRGQRDAYPQLLRYFEGRLARDPAEAVLADHLPALLSGWHVFAFHGLIRTAHAWEAGQPDELAAALATWASWHEVLPTGRPAKAGRPRLPLSEWAAGLRSQAKGWRSELPMISWRMLAATQTDLYADWAERLAPAASLAQARDDLIDLALQTYLHSRNFTVLHLITGLRALRVLLPLVPTDAGDEAGEVLQAALARAVVAGWLAGRVNWLEQPKWPDADSLDWPTLLQAALAQTDEHAIKLTHACWQEDRLRPDPRWRQAAALLLRQGHALAVSAPTAAPTAAALTG